MTRHGRPVIGFLHTDARHEATFDRLVAGAGAGAGTVHRVRPDLLAAARTGADVAASVADEVRRLIDAGADAIVVTCSSLGPVAEDAAWPVPLWRVDRPMAARAVATGSRIAVVAALESTVAPTSDLVQQEARRVGRDVTLTMRLIPDAWQHFEDGRLDDYEREIARAAVELAPDHDVVMLAQASMAGALTHLTELTPPVLASPEAAVDHALSTLTAHS